MSKFNVTDVVWVMLENKPVEAVVTAVKESFNQVVYHLSVDGEPISPSDIPLDFSENDIFQSKEELGRQLFPDLLTSPWKKTNEELPDEYVDVIANFKAFMSMVCLDENGHWLSEDLKPYKIEPIEWMYVPK